MSLKLLQLSESLKEEFFEYLQSFKDREITPASIDMKNKTFSEYLEYLHLMKTDPPRLLVPATTLFLLNEETNKIIGAIYIRHFLSGQIIKYKGNIEYSIKKEFANEKMLERMLGMAKGYMQSVELNEILICCDSENEITNNAMINLKAELENQLTKTENEKEILINRYWISVDEL